MGCRWVFEWVVGGRLSGLSGGSLDWSVICLFVCLFERFGRSVVPWVGGKWVRGHVGISVSACMCVRACVSVCVWTDRPTD